MTERKRQRQRETEKDFEALSKEWKCEEKHLKQITALSISLDFTLSAVSKYPIDNKL